MSETIVCKVCGLAKSFENFHVNKPSRNGRLSICNPCYSIKYKDGHRVYMRTWLKSKPWVVHHSHAKSRGTPGNYTYIKGRTCSLTIPECKELWFRDKAYLLKRPSIDRINNSLGYFKENCRFIELSENSRLGRLGCVMSDETKQKISIARKKARAVK